jgi:C-terminal processing protease CtpA/Prc
MRVTLVREGQLSGVSVMLEESRLDQAWGFMLDSARVSSLSPSEPVIVELSPNTYRVQARDIQHWRSFYWADTSLARYHAGVLIRNTKESPAGQLGLRYADAILTINGTPIVSPDDIEAVVMNAIGQQVNVIEVEIQRGRGTPMMTLRYEVEW